MIFKSPVEGFVNYFRIGVRLSILNILGCKIWIITYLVVIQSFKKEDDLFISYISRISYMMLAFFK